MQMIVIGNLSYLKENLKNMEIEIRLFWVLKGSFKK
jgi:hypothetical protein